MWVCDRRPIMAVTQGRSEALRTNWWTDEVTQAEDTSAPVAVWRAEIDGVRPGPTDPPRRAHLPNPSSPTYSHAAPSGKAEGCDQGMEARGATGRVGAGTDIDRDG